MVLGSILKKVKKEKEFLVTLSGRGKQMPLGKLSAKNHQELMTKILEKLNEMGDQALEYTRIRILDLETLKELRIKNPYSEDSEQGRSEKSKSSLIDANMIIDQFVWFLKMNNQLTSTILGETMKTMANIYGELLKNLASLKIESVSEKPQPIDLGSLTQFLNLVLSNKDKLEELLKRGLT
jgi:hypothetical protein